MTVEVLEVPGVPEIAPGDDLAASVGDALARVGVREGDVVVVTQKIVSKAEGRLAPASDRQAVVESETARVVARRGDLVIAETHHGFVCANAGVDASNAGAPDTLVLLPLDPDASARALRARLGCAVVITDSFGRAWRQGQCEIAIGCAGLAPIRDWRGEPDSEGRELHATQIAIADEVAAAADLVRGKDTRQPAVRIRGLERYVIDGDGPGAAALIRSREADLFP